jgi:hypothetical protein
MNDEACRNAFRIHESPVIAERRIEADYLYLLDLIKVLRPHPGGLRRWSIMRAIRKSRETAKLPIPQKLEDAVERVFRSHCADSENFKKKDNAPDAALFYWPQGKRDGVWAVYPDRAEAWLKAEGVSVAI